MKVNHLGAPYTMLDNKRVHFFQITLYVKAFTFFHKAAFKMLEFILAELQALEYRIRPETKTLVAT